MFTQAVTLFGLIILGAFISIGARRADLQGIELWLPFGLLVSYAYSPLWGFLIAFLMLLISWIIFPYGLQYLALTSVFLIPAFAITKFFPVTEASFFTVAMGIVIAYNIISNAAYIVVGANIVRVIKFAAFSIAFNWTVMYYFGWTFIQWLV
ncbi:TPA: hypothetical protein H1008_01420 [archaeon]|nr:hypothetical protein [Candidatus Undinarchaeales archaeon SRR5007147.bin71]